MNTKVFSIPLIRLLVICLIFFATRGAAIVQIMRAEATSNIRPTQFESLNKLRLAGDDLAYLTTAMIIGNGTIGDYFNIRKDNLYPLQTFPPYWRTPIFREPLQPLYILLTYRMGGNDVLGVRIANVILGFLAMVLGFSIIAQIAPVTPRAGTLFGWINAIYPTLFTFNSTLGSENLDYFLMALSLWFIMRLPDAKRLIFYICFGGVTGLLLSLKAYWVYMVPITLGFIIYGQYRLQLPMLKRLACISLFIFSLGGVLLPTLIRNYRYTEGSLTLSTKNGFNIWKDNNTLPVENHDYGEGPGTGAQDCVKAAIENGQWPLFLRPPCQVPLKDFDACEKRQAISFLMKDPGNWVIRAIEKNMHLWSPNSFTVNRAKGPHYWGVTNTMFWIVLQLIDATIYSVAILFFIISLTAGSKSAKEMIIKYYIAFGLLFLICVASMGHGFSRFRLPYMFGIFIISSIAVFNLREKIRHIWRSKRRTGIWAILTISFITLVITKIPTVMGPIKFQISDCGLVKYKATHLSDQPPY